MNTPTQRLFKCLDSGYLFRLHTNAETHEPSLFIEPSTNPEAPTKGTEVNGWYLSMTNPVDIKINNTKVVKIPVGFFYNLKEDEIITHKKFIGFDKRFKKA